MNGQRADIAMKKGKPMIDATITATDVEATNGVVHVIDAVILPESKNVLEIAKAADRSTPSPPPSRPPAWSTSSRARALHHPRPDRRSVREAARRHVQTLLKPENKGPSATS